MTTASATPTPHQPPTPDSGAIDLTDAIQATACGQERRLDVLVIGAGQAGLALAWYLNRAGARYLVVDADPRLVTPGAPGGTHCGYSPRPFQPARDTVPGTGRQPPHQGPGRGLPRRLRPDARHSGAARHARPSADADRGAGSWPRPRTAASPLTRSWSRRARSTAPHPLHRGGLRTRSAAVAQQRVPHPGPVAPGGTGARRRRRELGAPDRRGGLNGSHEVVVAAGSHPMDIPATVRRPRPVLVAIAPRRGRWFRRGVDDRGRAARAAARAGGAAAGWPPPRQTASRPPTRSPAAARAAPGPPGRTRSRSAHRAGARSPGPRS